MFKRVIIKALTLFIIIVNNYISLSVNKLSEEFDEYTYQKRRPWLSQTGIFINPCQDRNFGLYLNANIPLSKITENSAILEYMPYESNPWHIDFVIRLETSNNLKKTKEKKLNSHKKNNNATKQLIFETLKIAEHKKFLEFSPKLHLGISLNKKIPISSKYYAKYSLTPIQIEVLQTLINLNSILKNMRKSKDLTNAIDMFKDKNFSQAALQSNNLMLKILKNENINSLEQLKEIASKKEKQKQIFKKVITKKIINPIINKICGNSIEILQNKIEFNIPLDNTLAFTTSSSVGLLPIKILFPVKKFNISNIFTFIKLTFDLSITINI